MEEGAHGAPPLRLIFPKRYAYLHLRKTDACPKYGIRATYLALWVVMHKSTVYLPDDLKDALERAARETKRSEAEIIREGIRLVIAQADIPPPQTGVFDSGGPSLSQRVDELLSGFGEQ
jgi:Ribbon-helix-helix protein, copG family